MSNSPQQSNPFGNVYLVLGVAILLTQNAPKATTILGLILGLTGIGLFFATLS